MVWTDQNSVWNKRSEGRSDQRAIIDSAARKADPQGLRALWPRPASGASGRESFAVTVENHL